MTNPRAIEREVKLGAWPGYALPDLDGLRDGMRVGASEEQRLDAVYYDTPELRLLRRGVTLRFRRGEQADGLWTAKLPGGPAVVGLARQEIKVTGRADSIPEPLGDLLRGWAMGSPLSPVARLRTRRRRTAVVGDKDQPLALLDDDEVSVLRRSRVAARFRELEVELAEGAPDALLPELVERLQAAGAQRVDQVPKLVQALGPAAVTAWELAEPELGAHPTAAEVIRAGMVAAVARFVDHQAVVVLDEDPEGVHQARVGLRRLRSELRIFGELLDGERLRPLRDELGWFSHELGAVRDLDVLIATLRADVKRLPPKDRPAADALLGRLANEREDAYRRLREAMRSGRYCAMLDELGKLAQAPPFASSDADRDAAVVLPALVRHPLRRLRREAEQLGKAPDDDALHGVRILVKRLRYATDLAVPVAPKRARQGIRALRDLQELLGEHNDACLAVTRLRELIDDASGADVWSAGLLGGLQITRTNSCRARFPALLKSALAKKNWAWTA